MIGQTISHYTILEKLGEGGMGVVYKAHDAELDRDVALKFLPTSFTSDSRERERFYHEARAASALNHPNITTIHEIKEYDGRLYLAMELIEGNTLKQLAEGEPLTTEKILDIAIQASEGLKAAHQKLIVHRDIKSANIMVTPTGHVKIMDFGLAKVQGATKLTMTGSTIGTAAYMSPEQARGEDVDQRTDIFSFGVVLYELLAGRLPFRGEHPAALMYSIVNEDPQPISKYNEKVTPGIEQMIRRALAKDRDERYQSIDALLTDLRSERKRIEYPDAGYAPTVRPIARPKRHLIRIGATAAAAIILVVLALFFNLFNLNIGLRQDNAEPQPSLAVIGFENISNPADKSHTGEVLTHGLITALFDTKGLDVISRERLYDIQKDLGQGGSNVISPVMASEIARRAGASHMLLGSILQVEPTLTVAYRVIDVTTDKILNTKRVSENQSGTLLTFVDTLSSMVKHDLNIETQTSPASKTLTDVTTKSPEAYRAYVEGLELFLKVHRNESRIAFEKAIELDSNFAMAHYYLGFGALGGNTDPNELRKAWELRTRVTDIERMLIEARYAGTLEDNPAKNAEILEQLIRKYPREQRAIGELQTVYWLGLCAYDRALEAGERGLRNDPTDKTTLTNQCYLRAVYNKRTEALLAADTYLQLAPAEFNPYDTKGDVFLAFGEPDSALTWWKKALQFNGSSASAFKAGYQNIVWRNYPAATDYFHIATNVSDEESRAEADRETVLVPIHRGELTEATRLLTVHAKLHRAKERLQLNLISGITRVGSDLGYLIVLAYEEGNHPEMLRHARERSEEIRRQRFRTAFDLTSPIDGRYEIAWALSAAGKDKESSLLMSELNGAQRPGLRQRQRQHEYFTALCALERGDYDAAVEQFDKSMKEFPPIAPPQYHYAVALLKSGRVAEAISEFQRMTWWSQMDDLGLSNWFSPMAVYWPIAAVKAHYWLGVAYEQQGKRGEAMKEYETFLETWKNADFKSKEMEDAKVRLAGLRKADMK